MKLVSALASLFLAGSADAQIISRDTTWSGGTVYVSRDVTVTDGAVLTIAPGTVVEFGYDDTIFVRDGSRVVVDGAVLRPRSTLGNSAAIYVHEVRSAGSLEVRNSTLEHVYVYTTGSGENVFENNRFSGEANLRLFSTAGATVRGNAFESVQPIWTEITFPSSRIEANVFARGSVINHPNPQRITRADTVRTYQGLPIQVASDISVTAGAALVIPAGMEIRQGFFNAFIVNGRALLKAEGVHFRPSGSRGDFPAIIISQGDGPGRAEITRCVMESLSIQFSGGTGFVTETDFLVSPGRTALTNTATEPVDARGNYWNGSAGPAHLTNPQGNGAAVSGPVTYSPWQAAAMHSILTGIDRTEPPGEFLLGSTYPNPFSGNAVLTFSTPRTEHVSIELYDVTGRLLKTLLSDYFAAGRHELKMTADDLASGMYLLRMVAGESTHTSNVIVTR